MRCMGIEGYLTPRPQAAGVRTVAVGGADRARLVNKPIPWGGRWNMEAPERIEVNAKKELVLSWADRERQVIPARTARAACTCASCRSGGALRAANSSVPVTIEAASLVGAYGLNLEFGPDGHRTGIFDWATLRAIGEIQPQE